MIEKVIIIRIEGPEEAVDWVTEIVENEIERLAFEQGCKVIH